MASIPAERVLAGTVVVAVAATAVASRCQTMSLDSVYQEPRNRSLPAWRDMPAKSLVFPRNMLWSKQITVQSTEQVSHDTKRIRFRLPGGNDEVSGVPPGGAILTQHTPPGAYFPIVRPYSPIHQLDERGVLELLVKQYPKGRASVYLHSLNPGDELTVRGPLPSYNWKPSSLPRSILLIAGGAGITPIYSLAQGVLRNPQDRTNLSIVWGVNSSKDVVLGRELESLAQQYPGRVQMTYCVSKTNSESESVPHSGSAMIIKGYIDQTVLQDAVGSLSSKKNNWGDIQGTKVFFCGPPGMQEAIAGRKGLLFHSLGLSKKEVHIF